MSISYNDLEAGVRELTIGVAPRTAKGKHGLAQPVRLRPASINMTDAPCQRRVGCYSGETSAGVLTVAREWSRVGNPAIGQKARSAVRCRKMAETITGRADLSGSAWA